MKNFFYIDLFTENSEHLVLTKSVASLLQKYEVTYYISQNSHLNGFITKDIYKYNVKKTRLYRWVSSCLLLISILFRVRNEKIIFTYFLPFHYLILWIFSKFKKNEIYIFLHGELKYVFHPEGFGQKLGGVLLKYIGFNLCGTNFIAISHTVYEKLLSTGMVANLSHIEHPIKNILYETKKSLTTVGLFGTLSLEKNSHILYKFVTQLEEAGGSELKFITVGSSGQGFQYDLHPKVSHFCRGTVGYTFHADDSFFNKVKELDFCLLFNDTSKDYAWIPSAVIYDCLEFGIPILSLNNNTVRSYNRKYGQIGIDFVSLDDFVVYLSQDRTTLFKDFEKLRISMKLVSSKLSSAQFEDTLKRRFGLQ